MLLIIHYYNLPIPLTPVYIKMMINDYDLHKAEEGKLKNHQDPQKAKLIRSWLVLVLVLVLLVEHANF